MSTVVCAAPCKVARRESVIYVHTVLHSAVTSDVTPNQHILDISKPLHLYAPIARTVGTLPVPRQ